MKKFAGQFSQRPKTDVEKLNVGEHEINYIVDAITRYSGNRDVPAINMFVEKHYNPVLDAFYINGKQFDVV